MATRVRSAHAGKSPRDALDRLILGTSTGMRGREYAVPHRWPASRILEARWRQSRLIITLPGWHQSRVPRAGPSGRLLGVPGLP
jgi:hypothetical protein